jgi:hypothetical protein
MVVVVSQLNAQANGMAALGPRHYRVDDIGRE